MKTSKKIFTILKRPLKLFRILGNRGFFNWIPDKIYLKIIYYCEVGKCLNLKNPKTFNEKIQWLKLYDRKPEYISYVDKYEVRKYISETIGDEYLIPLIDVYDNVDDIDWQKLPDQFVLKCTHGSSSNIICRNKAKLNIKSTKKQLKKWMNKSWFWFGREWPYKHIKPRIICEKYMVDESNYELKDYKFFCFSGEPRLLFVATDRPTDTKFNFYNLDFELINMKQYYQNSNKLISKPKGFEKMIELSKKLSENLPHVRVDFYDVNGKIYFGELTFYHFSGFKRFEPNYYDELLGEWLLLPDKSSDITY